MKKRFRFIGLVLVPVLTVIQFFPARRNLGARGGAGDIAAHYAVPKEVQTVLVNACYNCHSNHTDYPWYADIQPVGGWLNHHVREAKGDLNFSEFAAYPAKRAARKLAAIVDQVEQGDMPLRSYTWMHAEARLTGAQKKRLTAWAQALHDKITPE
jgi:hypothetical protein